MLPRFLSNLKIFSHVFLHYFFKNFFSMDLWSNDYTATPANRAAVVGFAPIGYICTSNKYSIIEEIGGFLSVLVSSLY
jgi:hypothetical protein